MQIREGKSFCVCRPLFIMHYLRPISVVVLCGVYKQAHVDASMLIFLYLTSKAKGFYSSRDQVIGISQALKYLTLEKFTMQPVNSDPGI